MSTSDKKVSDGEPGEPKNDSVFDFLYNDARRIGTFLAQFDDSGHLQEVRQSERAKREHQRGYKLSAGAGLPMMASGNLGFERSPHDAGEESSERTYDPLWSNALTLLDFLEEASLISRDINTAHLGQFVIASGHLSVFNAAILTKVFESQHTRELAAAQSVNNAMAQWNADPKNATLKAPDRAKAKKAFRTTVDANTRSLLDMLPYFPYSAQCTIKGDNFSVWSTLSVEGMVGTVADLSLKHGTEVPGLWNLLGVLDALPSPIPAQIQILPSPTPTHFASLIKNYSNLGRAILGRPPEAFGVLFREIAAGSVAPPT